MKLRNQVLIIFSCLSLVNHLLAEVPVTLIEPEAAKVNPNYKWSNSSYVGYAWSLKPGLVNPDTTKFTKVAPGDTDDLEMTNVSYAGISLGRHIFKCLLVSLSYEIFNSFNYQKYHSGGSLPGSTVLDTNFLRSFSITHQSVLLNLSIDFPDKWKKQWGDVNIMPALGAGLGVGINLMSGFQTLVFSGTPPVAALTTQGLLNLKNSLAWYVNVGISFQPTDTEANFGIAYRYYNGGKFSSGSRYVINDSNEEALVDLAAWTGIIKTNQIKLFLNFDF